MKSEYKFKINGRGYVLSRKELLAAYEEVGGRGGIRKYYVKVQGKSPASPKDIVLEAIKKKYNNGIARIDFTTEYAVRILKKLGFEVLESEGTGRNIDTLLSYAGAVKLGGDSLKDPEFYEW